MYSPRRRLRLFRSPAWTGPAFVNPTATTGSAVTTVAQSPFAGGGNSYSFTASSNAYISFPSSTDWDMRTGDFTIEWFGYQTELSGFQRAFTLGDYPSASIAVSIESVFGHFYVWENGPYRFRSLNAATANTWYHWAIVRRSGTPSVYRNGTLLGSSYADTQDMLNTVSLYIGNTNTSSSNNAWVGYITNFRWVKGLAVYTGDFTVPTGPLRATAGANPYGGSNTVAIGAGYTKLLLVP